MCVCNDEEKRGRRWGEGGKREGGEISKKEQNYIVGGSKRNELEKKR